MKKVVVFRQENLVINVLKIHSAIDGNVCNNSYSSDMKQ